MVRADLLVETPAFRLVSRLDPATTSAAAAWLGQAAEQYERDGWRLQQPNLPTVAVLLPHALDLVPFTRESRTGRSQGVSLAGPDRNYILVGWLPPGDPWAALAHEYAHLVDPQPSSPLWLSEGFAEYLARSAFERPRPHPGTLALLEGGWIPLNELTSATRRSPVFQQPGFYAQCWLAMEWLTARGAAASELSPELFWEHVQEAGLENTEKELRDLAARFAAALQPAVPPAVTVVDSGVQLASEWEIPAYLADMHRALGRREQAEAILKDLDQRFPNTPRIYASLGALELERGNYDRAEQLLAVAAQAIDAEARTFHRYALMLLRPKLDPAPQRADQAALYAGLAVEKWPDEPTYRLTFAQALMVAERWNEAIEELAKLAAKPGWRRTAADEYAEVERRRAQSLWRIPAPGLDAPPAPKLALFEEAPFALGPPLPPRAPSWPPPGASIIVGKIANVDCSSSEKVIVLASPLFPLRFREPKDRPARLFSPPLNWKTIPCGTYGWYVNLAYRPVRGARNIRGEVVAILF